MFFEVNRVLKNGGTFLICNESDGTNAADEKWTKLIDGMKIYTSDQLIAALKEAGFTEIKTYSNTKNQLDKYCCNEIANFKFVCKRIENRKFLQEDIKMVGRIYHVGLTVSDLDRSIAFYRDILGLEFQGEIFMKGEETDKMFRKDNCKARVAYLNGSKAIEAPPVELIQFVDNEIHKTQSDLFTTSISEVCFYTDDIDSVYRTLIENHVECLSEPQYFDFRADGFGESRAFYFRDPDGIILEMMQPL